MGVMVGGRGGSRRHGGGSWRSAEFACASSSSSVYLTIYFDCNINLESQLLMLSEIYLFFSYMHSYL